MGVSFLPTEDIEFLNGNDLNWVAHKEDGKNGIEIQGYCLPTGYTPSIASLMIIIPPNYPVGIIDMFYFSPHISRTDGQAIDALADETHFEKAWQRWSRHYLPGQWRPSVDNVATHITLVGNILKSELGNQ